MRRHAKERAGRPAMRHKDRGVWQTWSWAQAYDNVRALAQGLSDLGLERGDKIAVVGANRPVNYWAITAAQMLRAIPVPVYSEAIAEELSYVLENAEVKVIVAQDQEQVDKVLAAERLTGLAHILFDEDRGLRDYADPRLLSVAEVMGRGRRALENHAKASELDASIDQGLAEDASIMLYTSGTTGRSKGVVLAAGRSVAAARDTVAFDRLTDRDEQLAYLPLAWVGDHYLNYAQGMVAGMCSACPESADTVAENLKEIGPTFYFAPPRVFEGQLTRIMIRMEDAGKFKSVLFHHFLAHARKWGEKILQGERVPLPARLHYALGEAIIYAPLKNALGLSRVRVAYTAGEAIGSELFSFYRSIGLNLKQLYGQTEAFLYVTCHADGAVRSDTVGAPAPHVDIRIAEDGEVQFKSPGQFVEYFKEPEKTAEAMTPDGYVKTGDAGFFDADGQLRIIDRARDVGKLRDGSLFAPKYIENKLKFFPNIKEAVAVGDGRDFATAMLNIDMAAVGAWAERNNVSYSSYQELAGLPKVGDMLQAHVEEVNAILSREPKMAGAQVRRFLILHKELDADDGELTRTQKVRRGFISDRYEPLVVALYGDVSEQDVSTQVTFEDGRTGTISARVKIRDVRTFAPVATTDGKRSDAKIEEHAA